MRSRKNSSKNLLIWICEANSMKRRWRIGEKLQRAIKITLFTVLAAEIAVVSSFAYQKEAMKFLEEH